MWSLGSVLYDVHDRPLSSGGLDASILYSGRFINKQDARGGTTTALYICQRVTSAFKPLRNQLGIWKRINILLVVNHGPGIK